MDEFTLEEKNTLKSALETYFIAGIIGTFTFFEVALWAKETGNLFVYVLTFLGVLVSGIMFVLAYHRIDKFTHVLNKYKFRDDSTKSLALLKRERIKFVFYIIFLIGMVVLLILSLKGTSLLLSKISPNELLLVLLSFTSTILSCYVLSRLLLTVCESWSKWRILSYRVELKKHTIVIRKQILGKNIFLDNLRSKYNN